MQLLIGAGAYVNKKDNNGYTILWGHLMPGANYSENSIIGLLVLNGATYNKSQDLINLSSEEKLQLETLRQKYLESMYEQYCTQFIVRAPLSDQSLLFIRYRNDIENGIQSDKFKHMLPVMEEAAQNLRETEYKSNMTSQLTHTTDIQYRSPAKYLERIKFARFHTRKPSDFNSSSRLSSSISFFNQPECIQYYGPQVTQQIFFDILFFVKLRSIFSLINDYYYDPDDARYDRPQEERDEEYKLAKEFITMKTIQGDEKFKGILAVFPDQTTYEKLIKCAKSLFSNQINSFSGLFNSVSSLTEEKGSTQRKSFGLS